MLAGGRGERTANLSIQRATGPEAASLIKESRHLARHAAKAGAGANDDRVIVGQFGNSRNRSVLIKLEPGVFRDLQRRRFRYPLDVHLRSGSGRAVSHGLGHRFDVAVG